jgi:RNA polymerase sigma-70 factor (ECF subfamily)
MPSSRTSQSDPNGTGTAVKRLLPAHQPYPQPTLGVLNFGGHLGQRNGLLELARSFDLAALGEIYDSYSPPLVRYATRLLGESDLAEECVAETFSRFLKALHNGSGPTDSLQAYLYQVAHHWITDYYRRQPPPTFSLNETLASDLNDPAQTAVENIEREQVRAALMRLTPEQREVVVLKYLEGWENADIAMLLGKPVGAIKALQHRALDALRRQVLPRTENSHE